MKAHIIIKGGDAMKCNQCDGKGTVLVELELHKEDYKECGTCSGTGSIPKREEENRGDC